MRHSLALPSSTQTEVCVVLCVNVCICVYMCLHISVCVCMCNVFVCVSHAHCEVCDSRALVNMCVLSLDVPINNERYVSLTFEVCEASVLHGFAGYFDSVLYDDLTMSEPVGCVCVGERGVW